MLLQTGIYALIFVVCIVLQSTLFHYIKIGGTQPDLLLVIVILVSVLKGKRAGAGLGLVYGFLEDLVIGKYIGLEALTKMLTGYLIGKLHRKIFHENIFVPVIAGILGTMIHDLSSFAILFLTTSRTFDLNNVMLFTSFAVLYNALVAVIVYSRFYSSTAQGLLKVSR